MAADSQATGAGRGDEAPRQSLALYRKYRPATFAEVRGQDHVTEPLRQALRSGRINHAYLFSGPRGCGKTSSARILARSLNCVNGPTPDPCGVCDSCVALAPSGPGSIDVIEIDAASHGGVDDARDLRERAFYAPVAGRYKIYIIDEAHMVTQQGFNALLKLVEEPPPHLKFIFATTEPEKVIPTIRSRTHHYPFRLMPPSVMRELAEEILNSEHVPFDPAVLPLVVRAGGGSARDTLSILDQLLAGSDADGIRYDRAVSLLGYTDASLLDEIVDAFAAADGAAVFRAVNRVIEGGHEPRRFATDMLDRFRDLIVLASVPDAISSGLLDVPPDRADALRGQAERYGLASLTRAADIVAVGLDQMRGATSPRLLLELMCAQVLLPAAASDERSVLARLERLEAGAAAAARACRPCGASRTIQNGCGLLRHPAASTASRRRPARPERPRPQPGAQATRQQPSGAADAAQPPAAAHAAGGPRRAAPAARSRRAAPQRPAPAVHARSWGRRRPGGSRRAARLGDRRRAQAGVARRGRGDQGQGPGRRDRDRQRERGLVRRRGAHPPLPAPGRREGLPGQQVRGPAQAGDRHHVRRQRGDPRGNRRRRRPVGRPASRPAVGALRAQRPAAVRIRPAAVARPGVAVRPAAGRPATGQPPVAPPPDAAVAATGAAAPGAASATGDSYRQGPGNAAATAGPPVGAAGSARAQARPRSAARSAPAATCRRCRRPRHRMTRILTRMTRTCPPRRSTSSPAWPSSSASSAPRSSPSTTTRAGRCTAQK